jgi:predicted transcriptional regulator
MYIETAIEDIKEANELITEVLLRKSDTITGATRNHLESLKNYLEEKKQTTFTNAEIRRNLRVKQTTLQRYNKQLLEEGYIKKIKGKKGQTYYFEIININEYQELKFQINKALENCLINIDITT